MSDYQKEFEIVGDKIAMLFSKPHESVYGASVKLTASEAREVARKLIFYANALDAKDVATTAEELKEGDYVLATKWHDGDSRDHWCCGFYQGMTGHKNQRYDIVDSEGNLFRNNGFRRCEKLHPAIGKYLVDNSQRISAVKILLWEYIKSEAHSILIENYDYEQLENTEQ